MRWRSVALGGWGLILLSCVPALARTTHEHHSREPHGGNCVAYAREVTGVHLDGNAATWWPHAEGRYERGHQPSVGAILVFKPHGRMHVGHVAVVSSVVNAREVLVDQANWVRGRVTKAISVIDTSPTNDWTSVKVQYAGTHGRENPTYGFIYPRVPQANFGETIVEPQHERHHDTHVAKAKHHKDAVEQEIVVEDDAPAKKPHRVAGNEAPHHHKHKAHEAEFAGVY